MSDTPTGHSPVTDVVASTSLPTSHSLASGDSVKLQCRQQRAEFLHLWDQQTESLIQNYEVNHVSVRREIEAVATEHRELISTYLQPIENEAEGRKFVVLQKYDTLRTKPSEAKSSNERQIKAAHGAVSSELQSLVDWLTGRGYSFERFQSDAADLDRFGVSLPESVKQTTPQLRRLRQLAIQTVDEEQPGLLDHVVDRFLMPGLGCGIAVLASALLSLSGILSTLSSILFGVALMSVAVVLHLVFLGPARRHAKDAFDATRRLLSVSETVTACGLDLSSATQRQQEQQLAAQRDHDLQVIDQWLQEQSTAVRRQQTSIYQAAVASHQERLDQLDVDLTIALSDLDDRMREGADRLAVEIAARLRSVAGNSEC